MKTATLAALTLAAAFNATAASPDSLTVGFQTGCDLLTPECSGYTDRATWKFGRIDFSIAHSEETKTGGRSKTLVSGHRGNISAHTGFKLKTEADEATLGYTADLTDTMEARGAITFGQINGRASVEAGMNAHLNGGSVTIPAIDIRGHHVTDGRTLTWDAKDFSYKDGDSVTGQTAYLAAQLAITGNWPVATTTGIALTNTTSVGMFKAANETCLGLTFAARAGVNGGCANDLSSSRSSGGFIGVKARYEVFNKIEDTINDTFAKWANSINQTLNRVADAAHADRRRQVTASDIRNAFAFPDYHRMTTSLHVGGVINLDKEARVVVGCGVDLKSNDKSCALHLTKNF